MRKVIAIIVPALGLTIGLTAQSKPALTRSDYGQFETLTAAGPRGGLSPDGQWIVYGINRSNRNNELRVTRISDGKTVVVAFGSQPAFSADSKWAAYSL